MKIRNHLITDFQVAGPFDGTHLFRTKLLSGEPVVVKDGGNFLGVLTLKDLISNPHNLVGDCLSNLPMVNAEDETVYILSQMSHHNYEYLPVIFGAEFQGLVSKMQLIDHVLRLNENSNENLITELKKELSLKNKFLAIIGHDVKNMFSQVLGCMELLDMKLDRMDSAKAHTILGMARKSAAQVNTAFDGMLLWARLASGQLPFQPKALMLNDHIGKAVNQFQLAGNVKNITITNCMTVNMEIYADSNMIDCILLNLIYNAIKFTPSGGEVWFNAAQTNSFTEIIIVDSGVGMSFDQRKDLFKQGRTTLGTSHETGAGIGLVICQEFMQRHSGEIIVDSEEGRGTHVTLKFPNSQLNTELKNETSINNIL